MPLLDGAYDDKLAKMKKKLTTEIKEDKEITTEERIAKMETNITRINKIVKGLTGNVNENEHKEGV